MGPDATRGIAKVGSYMTFMYHSPLHVLLAPAPGVLGVDWAKLASLQLLIVAGLRACGTAACLLSPLLAFQAVHLS